VEQIVDENVENQARFLLPKVNEFNTPDICTTRFANSIRTTIKKVLEYPKKVNLFWFFCAKKASSHALDAVFQSNP